MIDTPLKNKTIVITRSEEDSLNSAFIFERLGAQVILFPTLVFEPVNDWSKFDQTVKEIHQFDYLVFTSGRTVKFFSLRCKELNININFDQLLVIAVGEKTARICRGNNIPVNILPNEYSAEGILKALNNYDLSGKNFFIPGSSLAREELPIRLIKRGAKVKIISIYNVGIPSEEIIKKNLILLNSAKTNLFVFTSPSTFRNFIDILKITEPKNYFNDYDVAAIGPTTKEEIEKYNIKVKIIPQENTMDGLVEAIKSYYSN